jgi:excisionase family DNA binding protein
VLSAVAAGEVRGGIFIPASINDQMDAAMPKTTFSPTTPDAARTGATPLSRLAYGIEDAANALDLSRSRIYELIAVCEIAACKVGKRTIIPAAELTTFLERHRVERLPGGRAAPASRPRSHPEQ